MIFRYTKEEEKQYKALFNKYDKAIKDCEAEIEKCRPGDKGPEAQKRENEDTEEAYNRWVASGSDEWRQAREALAKIEYEKRKAIQDFYYLCEHNHFKELNDDVEKVKEHARRQVTLLIDSYYKDIESKAKTGTVQDHMARVTKDGFYLDTGMTVEMVKSALHLHYELFTESPELVEELDQIIISEVVNSPYVSSEKGVIFGEITAENLKANASVTVARPQKYTTTVDKLTQLFFTNELTTSKKNLVYPVPLSRKSNIINVYASINYDSLPELKTSVKLNDNSYWVHDGIITNWLAGNRTMTIDMIYRGMTGKVDGNICVSDDIRQLILDNLKLFRGEVTIDNKPDTLINPDTPHFVHKEPLIMYKWDMVELYGNKVEAITIPADAEPVLLQWAKLNGNELDTRDINLLNVKGLNNGTESSSIKMYLYRRIIAMRHAFDEATAQHKPMKMSRDIKLDKLYEKAGIEAPTPKKASVTKDKIEKCLDHWVDGGLITGYTFNKLPGTKKYKSVTIDFLKKLETTPIK